MKKNLLSLLILALMFGLTVSACAKKEEPAVPAVENVTSPVEDATAMQSNLDDDIFDLDTAKETLAGATEQAQEAAAEFADQAGDATQGVIDSATETLEGTKDETASLIGSMVDSADVTTEAAVATGADAVAAAMPATTPALTAEEEEAKKKLEEASASTSNAVAAAVQ